MYYSPNYFNYQSNELSKCLIQFGDPSVIPKHDKDSINVLISYGVNCFGGKISKDSINKKIDWVNNNKDNIFNYENGILIDKAKDKLLFLAFCIEYKAYINAMDNENLMEFHTYLPVQLDATCNGFQHMALLSNERTLFKELNLVVDGKDELDSKPKDFYNFLLHKLNQVFEAKKQNDGEKIDKKSGGNYERLFNFMWDRAFIKKAIMTIPYNSSVRSMIKYITDSLIPIEKEECDKAYLKEVYTDVTHEEKNGKNKSEKDNTFWYTDTQKNKACINNKDILLLVQTLKHIISHDFAKIKKLTQYLKNVSSLLNTLELPIVWTLPTGLTIKQSYLETRSTTITPFMHSKVKLNLKVTIKNKFDKNKQIRALMPNLIHSLDATSMSLLHKEFSDHFKDKQQLFSIHDCFGTTCDKVFVLKTILASVYTDIYSSDQYLIKFDNNILDYIENNTNYELDRKNRILYLPKTKYVIHDVEWVLNNKEVSSKDIKRIDSQHILV